MTTSQTTSLKSAISYEDAPLTPAQLGYFNARIQSKVHVEVLKLFRKLADDGKITRALIAQRLRKKPERITRWLGSSGNWTLATLSELLLAMGYEADISVRSLNDLPLSNMHHPSLAPTKAHYQEVLTIGKRGVGEGRRVLHTAGIDGWSEWVHPAPGYRMICCDCGLSHEMEFRIVEGEIVFRARRHARSTAQVRRHMKSCNLQAAVATKLAPPNATR